MSIVLYRKTYSREKAEESTIVTETNRHKSEMDGLSAKAFFDKLEESITLTPLPEREEGAQRFIQAAIEISACYELDIEVRLLDSCISIDLVFDIGPGIKGLNRVFGMADEFGFVTGINGHNVIVTMEYYTHAVFLNRRQIDP